MDGAALVRHALGVHQENQLVGRQFDRSLGGDVFQAEVENFAGRRIADGRQQHDVVLVEAPPDRGRIDLADFARVQQIDAVAHAQRLCGDKIARGHPDIGARHRRVGQPQRQQRLDLDPHGAGGFLDARQRGIVGDAQAIDVADGGAVFGQPRFDLRPHAMHQHQPHAQAVQQVDVMRQLDEPAVRHQFAAKGDDESLAAKPVNVGRGGAKPVDEIGGVFQRFNLIWAKLPEGYRKNA